MADLEGALKRLDQLTQEEARMALAEVLGITYNIRDEVKVVDGKVEDVGDEIGNKVQCVDEKVQAVINGTRGVSHLSAIPSNTFTFRRRTSKIDSSAGGKKHRRSPVFVTSRPRRCFAAHM